MCNAKLYRIVINYSSVQIKYIDMYDTNLGVKASANGRLDQIQSLIIVYNI
jgi:hypothetical protein